MSTQAITQKILGSSGVRRGPSRSADAVRESFVRQGINLPAAHVSFLSESDGITTYGGYFRLLPAALGGSPVLTGLPSISAWNDFETWKFAWHGGVHELLCFGETAWGDQYAYRVADLRESSSPQIYFMESVTLQPEPIASSFEGFLEGEFLRNCLQPYDDQIIYARKKFGELSAREHITYSPSPLITGETKVENIIKIDAIASMVINGDLESQIGSDEERPIKELKVFTDSNGRSRLRVIWG